MANLFRCPIIIEKKEYIMKAVGLVQNGYTADAIYDRPFTDGENAHGTYWAEATNAGETFVRYAFDATNWNKLYVNQAYYYRYSSNTRSGIGVVKNYHYIADMRNNWVYTQVTQEKTDYVIDISTMSGTMWFFIHAESNAEFTYTRAKTFVEGDVYLTK